MPIHKQLNSGERETVINVPSGAVACACARAAVQAGAARLTRKLLAEFDVTEAADEVWLTLAHAVDARAVHTLYDLRSKVDKHERDKYYS